MYEIKDVILTLSLILNFIQFFWNRIRRTVLPMRVNVEFLKPVLVSKTARTDEKRKKDDYWCSVYFHYVKVTNKGNWLTDENRNWFTYDIIKNCYIRTSLIGLENIPEKHEKLAYENDLSDEEREELYVFNGTYEKYAEEIHSKYKKRVSDDFGFGNDESQLFLFAYSFLNHDYVYFGLKHHYRVKIPSKKFKIQLILHAEGIRKPFNYEVKIQKYDKIDFNLIDC